MQSLDNFINTWTCNKKKEEISNLLLQQGIDLNALKEEKNMSDVDDFDFICHVAFDKKPLTRKERANNVKNVIFSVNIAVLPETCWKHFWINT